MTVQDKIKRDLKEAMIARKTHVRDLLRVVIGEFNREGKTVSDERAIAIMKKMIENAKDQGNEIEVTILEAYLPQQMDRAELKEVIKNHLMNNKIDPTMKSMGLFMNYLKENYAGQYDGKIASGVVREILNK